MKKKALCLLLGVILALECGISALATTVTEVQQQKNETQNQLDQVNQSITAIENKRKEVQSQLSHLNEDLVDAMLMMEQLEADLEAKETEIDAAQEEFDRLKALEEAQYEAMKLRIQYMYERDGGDYISMLLSSKSLSELVNRADFVQEVSDYDDEKLNEYQNIKEMVAASQEVLEEEKADLEEAKLAQAEYQKELNSQIASAKSKVKNFESELAAAQAKVSEYQKTIQEQNAKIKKLQAEEAAKKAAEEAAKSSAVSGNSGSTSSGNTSSNVTVSGSGLGAQIAQYAVQFVGNPYVSGGTSLTNGADCSGFTYAVFKHFGISIPRISYSQSLGGKKVSLSEMLPGDIIYYSWHVGIYIGNGKIVHASSAKTGIKISDYNYKTPTSVNRYW